MKQYNTKRREYSFTMAEFKEKLGIEGDLESKEDIAVRFDDSMVEITTWEFED